MHRYDVFAPNLSLMTKLAGKPGWVEWLGKLKNKVVEPEEFLKLGKSIFPDLTKEQLLNIHKNYISKYGVKGIDFLTQNAGHIDKFVRSPFGPVAAGFTGFLGIPLVKAGLGIAKTNYMINVAKQFAKPGVMALGGIGLGLGAASMMRNRNNYPNQGFHA